MSAPTIIACGPAFPVPAMALDKGMTLRDWFAGQALAGRCFTTKGSDSEEKQARTAAKMVYKLADAMLAASSPARPAKPSVFRFGDEALELLRRGDECGVFEDAPEFAEDVRALLRRAGEAGVA